MASILIIDDSGSERAGLRKVLEGCGQFERILEAADGLAGLRLLLASDVDIVLCDLEIPGLDGEKLLRAKTCRARDAEVPFVFLTANRNLDRHARLLREGASDTITKPFHPADLLARLQLHLKVRRLQHELLQKNAVLERLSTTDAVTGLRTRRFINEVLSVEFLRAVRYRTPLTVLMADLDHFKSVNDRFGHPAGDGVLAGVGEILGATLRASDIAGRYGGEEFLVLLPQTELEGGIATAQRFREAVEAHRFDTREGERIQVTVSVGAASHDEARHRTPAELVMAADDALYRAKKEGRNRVAVSDDANDSEA